MGRYFLRRVDAFNLVKSHRGSLKPDARHRQAPRAFAEEDAFAFPSIGAPVPVTSYGDHVA